MAFKYVYNLFISLFTCEIIIYIYVFYIAQNIYVYIFLWMFQLLWRNGYIILWMNYTSINYNWCSLFFIHNYIMLPLSCVSLVFCLSWSCSLIVERNYLRQTNLIFIQNSVIIFKRWKNSLSCNNRQLFDSRYAEQTQRIRLLKYFNTPR